MDVFAQVFRPMLMVALLHYFETQAPEVLAWLFQALNAADIAGAPRPTPWERGLMRRYAIVDVDVCEGVGAKVCKVSREH